MKRLYINFKFEQEIPKEVLKDKNVYTSEIGFIIVKSEYKKKFEKKYNITLTDFSEWFTERYSETKTIHELIYEILEDEPLLKDEWVEQDFTDKYSPEMIKSTLNKLSFMSDDKIIEYILSYKLEEALKIVIKPFIMSESIKKYQERVNSLENQYCIDYYKKITDL